MQFTPQQLAGAGRYNAKTRIGNWLEDIVLEEERFKDYNGKQGKGGLASNARTQKLAVCNQPVPHTYSSDGILRFGDTVQIAHKESGGCLANDLWEETGGFGTNEYSVTVAPNSGASARNTFRLQRIESSMLKDVSSAEYEKDDILHYGEPFQLVCNQSLLVDQRTNMLKNNMYLSSVMKNDRKLSKVSNEQMVYMGLPASSATVWKARKAYAGKNGATERLLGDGQCVLANDSIVLEHRNTSQLLCANTKIVDYTDFGQELEVCAKLQTKTGKSHQLVSEFSGHSTGETAARGELATNCWSFVTASDQRFAADNRDLPAPPTPAALMQKVRDIVNKRGNFGIRGLARTFKIMDDGGDGNLDREDFKWGLYDYGVHLNDAQFEMLLDAFDRNKDGLISFDEFLVTIRGPMNERRLKFINMAYDLLDKDGSGVVTKSDIAVAYDTSEHPEVIAGTMTEDEVITEFMEQWETQEADGIVSRAEFEEYYKDVSASIDNDDYFELMMRNAWHISGGEGWCGNTSCRRVLVVHNNGSQEVVEIENDLGLDADDIQGMLDRLAAQGVTDIKRISLAD